MPHEPVKDTPMKHCSSRLEWPLAEWICRLYVRAMGKANGASWPREPPHNLPLCDAARGPVAEAAETVSDIDATNSLKCLPPRDP
jgi:hypothetical protein